MGEPSDAVLNRTEVIAIQNTLTDERIEIRDFKNIKAKREIKQKVLSLFNNQIFRSILKPREIDNNVRLNKLERQYQRGNDIDGTIERADAFGKKDINTISTFPSTITMVYTLLLSKEQDKVIDSFCGHNSRAEDVLALGRKYYGYDVHIFPIEFTRKSITQYPETEYELNLGSSESMAYADETFNFSITCPPYGDVEEYNKIYEEEVSSDLSSKDYQNFLITYEKCLKETYRVLKKGSFFVIVVGNFYKNKRYFDLEYDTKTICKKLGFELHACDIYNRGSNIGGDMNYKLFIRDLKRLPVIHEYILVFRKPSEEKLTTFIKEEKITLIEKIKAEDKPEQITIKQEETITIEEITTPISDEAFDSTKGNQQGLGDFFGQLKPKNNYVNYVGRIKVDRLPRSRG